MSNSPDAGQRVNDANAVIGETPTRGEPDPQQLKDEMTEAARGHDGKLVDQEQHVGDDVNAVKPEHRQNDAGE